MDIFRYGGIQEVKAEGFKASLGYIEVILGYERPYSKL